jgi:hypothetical protein
MGKLAWIRSTKARRKLLFGEPEKDALCMFEIRDVLLIWVRKRPLLWQSGVMPWRYVRFLEDAYERILLQHVGGGYRFIHPLFQEYFATPRTGSSISTQSQLSSPQP